MAAPAALSRARSARSIRDLMGIFRASVYHPSRGTMRQWMTHAERHLVVARNAAIGDRPIVPKGEPIELFVLCVFPLAKSKHRKTITPPRAWQTSKSAGDWDNLAKPICDVATGVLWHDDSQVSFGLVEKIVGAQGEDPRMEILVRPALNSPAHETFFDSILGSAMGAGSQRDLFKR